MAIYKLGDIVGFVRGNSTFQKKDLKTSGEFLALHYGKTYKKNIINDNFGYYVDREFYKENQVVKRGDTILITTSETINELGKVAYFDAHQNGLLGGEQIRLFPKTGKIIQKYIYYYFLSHQEVFRRFATGIKVFRVKGDDLRHITGNFPSILEQQKIIDIIEPHEKLFLSYSNCVRIDTIDDATNDINKLIDIIEPLEITLNKIKKLIKILLSVHMHGNDKKINDYIDWKSTGYAYKPNDKNGSKYKIYTIKNISNLNKFDKTNIQNKNILNIGDVVTGLSGTIGTAGIVNDDNWVSNQRTLALRSEYSLQIITAIKSASKRLRTFSTGAVQKNIKHTDILGIPFSIINIDMAKYTSDLFIKLSIMKIKLANIRKKLVKLLVK